MAGVRMVPGDPRWVRIAGYALVAMLPTMVLPTVVRGQARSGSAFELAGEVRSIENGAPISGARVTLTSDPATDGLTHVTDESGEFRFASLSPGSTTLVIRRLGFYPETVTVVFPRQGSMPLIVPLALQVPMLSSVVVRSASRNYSGPMAGFNKRKDAGFGQFITREQIERRRATRTTDLLRSIAGVTISRGETGMASVRMRGTSCGDPHVWLDGMPVGTVQFFDLDNISPQSIEGIEIYNGVATIPAEIRGPRADGRCGALVVWTRRGENRRKRAPGISPEMLTEQIEDGRLFTADQTDRSAVLQRDLMDLVDYPASLLDRREAALVVLEFVVDTEGHVEMETVSVVATSDLVLSNAVRAVLPKAVYVVALRGGQPVRQLVQLPMRFDFSGTKPAVVTPGQ